MATKAWFHAVVTGFRKLRDLKDRGDKFETLESLMSFRMGSAPNGGTVSHLMCGNSSGWKSCPERGLNICPHCRLIKYCSEKCKNQHWAKHRFHCMHPYLSDTWEPSWIADRRDPAFLHPSTGMTLFRQTVDFWGDLPAIDCFQLANNEGYNNAEPLPDLKLCFAASGNLRNLIRTINALPVDYTGYCDVLLNETDPILVNRNLLILFVLLSPGPSIEEAAEFCVHLVYSAALPAAGADYLQRCVNFIYACRGEFEADLSFRRCLGTRGEGHVYCVQPSAGVKRPLEMFHSNYTLSAAVQSMKETTLAADRLDFREKSLAKLKPAHRMASQRFRESGILAPFSLNTNNFTQPNRLLFSPQGTWMVPEDANALFGWDLGVVRNSGIKHGTSPEDISGCLFFHVKNELRDFARRVKELKIDIHLTSFAPTILAKGIAIGAMPGFEDASFDRISTSNLVDSIGLRACLSDWGPLLNRENKFATLLAHTKSWHSQPPPPHAAQHWGPRAMKLLEAKCHTVPGLDVKMKTVFAQGLRSPALCRIVDSLSAFHDNEPEFQEYLNDQNAERSAAAFDLRLRSTHRVHPKRLGMPLNAPKWQRLPDLSSNEFYDLFIIGGANLPVRFLEFEGIGRTEYD
ncbi:DUF4470 domain-containing protein [Favolaschia claudopus]|uniref:DUF4470 domain-containing protein n=1 Tax=Favolaschia claudopus TaxID=2862362 RepID=A0AAW0BYI8_9AGAR